MDYFFLIDSKMIDRQVKELSCTLEKTSF